LIPTEPKGAALKEPRPPGVSVYEPFYAIRALRVKTTFSYFSYPLFNTIQKAKL
jgi:hypothetical protein